MFLIGAVLLIFGFILLGKQGQIMNQGGKPRVMGPILMLVIGGILMLVTPSPPSPEAMSGLGDHSGTNYGTPTSR